MLHNYENHFKLIAENECPLSNSLYHFTLC